MNADSIKIECEEDGFWMVVRTDELEGDIRVRIHDIAEEVYDHVKAAIGPWLRERDEARRDYRLEAAYGRLGVEPRNAEMRDAYDISDPKHPDFHSIHADIWDNREGK